MRCSGRRSSGASDNAAMPAAGARASRWTSIAVRSALRSANPGRMAAGGRRTMAEQIWDSFARLNAGERFKRQSAEMGAAATEAIVEAAQIANRVAAGSTAITKDSRIL